MKRIFLMLTMTACEMCAQVQVGGSASAVAPGTAVSPAESFNATLSILEGQIMALVKAMPADKYGFAPEAALFVPSQKTEYTGVRTFGALAIHLAQANYGLAGPIGGMKPDVDVASLSTLKDKDEIVAALAASFAFVHKAIGTLTADNAFQSVGGPMTRVTQTSFVMAHCEGGYGQMVEYLRMNGIVPPASRKK